MAINEHIEKITAQYQETVKPLLEQGHLWAARMEMMNLRFYMQEFRREIQNYPGGLTCMASAQVLEEKLEAGQDPSGAIRMFENVLKRFETPAETGTTY